jgi:mono/diheme cytochrome c family protein
LTNGYGPMKTIALLLSLGLSLCRAEPLPAPAELQQLLKTPPQVVTVIEPHLSVAGSAPVQRHYLGYPAAQVLRQLLGADWHLPQQEIEFRALDGFVARIPTERFATYRAHLVFAQADAKAPFSVDNKAQGEKDVALGPYYLVWDNIAAPELLADGGAQWPYQVAQISLRPAGSAAFLLPPGMSAKQWGEHAALAQKFCLSCHQINGFGGDKMPLNLAVRAKLLDERTWRQWLLNPQALKPGTAMPALPETMALAEREALAAKLHSYLKALPVLP